jgi:predicted nucleotide-binding protein
MRCPQEHINMLDVDNSIHGSNIFLQNIIDNMKEADVMICDITPDFIPEEHKGKDEIDITPCINSNVMYELGYFECLHEHKNIIMIIDKNICKAIPSMLRGHYITRYDYSSENVEDEILEKLYSFNKL